MLTVVAGCLYLLALTLTFGLRTIQHLRRTARSGWVITADAGPPSRFARVGFAVSLGFGVLGLSLSAAGVTPSWSAPAAIGLGGIVVAVFGLLFTIASQTAMGDSWRIGVDPSEITTLVTGGPFRWARNPIFTGMLTTQFGVVLMAPNWLTGVSLISLAAAVQLQVRSVEEPYLLRSHGAAYRSYAVQVGRFLPGVGRLRRNEVRLPTTSTRNGR